MSVPLTDRLPGGQVSTNIGIAIGIYVVTALALTPLHLDPQDPARHAPETFAGAALVALRDKTRAAGQAATPPSPEKIPMSGTETAAPAAASPTLKQQVDAVAEKAIGFLAAVGTDWQAIKASPLYAPLVQAATAAVTAEAGSQASGLINIGGAVSSALDTCAALHPTIQT